MNEKEGESGMSVLVGALGPKRNEKSTNVNVAFRQRRWNTQEAPTPLDIKFSMAQLQPASFFV
jgi:hypothetical protein